MHRSLKIAHPEGAALDRIPQKAAAKHHPWDDFISVARRPGADESKERFKTKLKMITTVSTTPPLRR